jgi:hypothetical protein
LAGLNPKNLSLAAAAVLIVAQSGVSTDEQRNLGIAFAAIGSMTVLMPVLYVLLMPKGAAQHLTIGKTWLIRSNAVIMTALLLLIGGKLTVQALMALAG